MELHRQPKKEPIIIYKNRIPQFAWPKKDLMSLVEKGVITMKQANDILSKREEIKEPKEIYDSNSTL